MNLHLLRIFFVVTEKNSFSRAAKALFISQPAVSKGVRELEHQLGLPLIERGVRGRSGVQLTESGQAIREHARGIFALERAAINDIEARINLDQGRLVVGASTTVAGYTLPPYVARFLQHHPLIELKVLVGNTRYISHHLIDCEVDLALVEGAVNHQRITSHKWKNDPLSIVVSKNCFLVGQKKISKSTLSEQVWIMREQGSGTRDVTEKILSENKITPQKIIEIGSNEGVARAVAGGIGVAMLPTIMVRDLIQLQQINVLSQDKFMHYSRDLYLLHVQERPLSPLVRQFTDFLKINYSHF